MPGMHRCEPVLAFCPKRVVRCNSYNGCNRKKEVVGALVDELAELMYSAEMPFIPWVSAVEEDKDFYTKVAEVAVDAVITHLESKNEDFAGAFSAAASYLRTETEIARMRRTPQGRAPHSRPGRWSCP